MLQPRSIKGVPPHISPSSSDKPSAMSLPNPQVKSASPVAREIEKSLNEVTQRLENLTSQVEKLGQDLDSTKNNNVKDKNSEIEDSRPMHKYKIKDLYSTNRYAAPVMLLNIPPEEAVQASFELGGEYFSAHHLDEREVILLHCHTSDGFELVEVLIEESNTEIKKATEALENKELLSVIHLVPVNKKECGSHALVGNNKFTHTILFTYQEREHINTAVVNQKTGAVHLFRSP